MRILHLDGRPFTTGRSRYLDQASEGAERTAKIWVKVRFGDLPATTLAQLDTGAAWSIVDPEIADALGLFDIDGEEITVSSRIFTGPGRLVKTPLEILADEGHSLRVEATVWASPMWPGPNFLGYSGLLDHMRIALDPSPSRNDFFFGSLADA